MKTVIIAERKINPTTYLIFFALLLTGVVISLFLDPLFSIIFIVFMVIPSAGMVQYLWNVPSKIELSKEQIVISYGRSILETVESGGSFVFPSITKLKWKNITDFNIKRFTFHDPDNGGDRGAVTTNYDYLFVTCNNIDKLNPNTNQRYELVLNRFEKTPEEILAICKQFQNAAASCTA
jgi:hypothetical protein